jgi:phosphopantetheinyl transferase
MVSKSFTIESFVTWRKLAHLDGALAGFSLPDEMDAAMFVDALGEAERERSAQVGDVDERRHFIARRMFQRYFVAKAIGWQHALRDLPMRHQLDQRTLCDAAPDMVFSFSSSQNLNCASAARGVAIGIDVERRRVISNRDALAQRFFTKEEAERLHDHPEGVRDDMFLRMWTAKEAGLKALGAGIVSGLNRFEVISESEPFDLRCSDDDGAKQMWSLSYPDLGEDCICALVHRALT